MHYPKSLVELSARNGRPPASVIVAWRRRCDWRNPSSGVECCNAHTGNGQGTWDVAIGHRWLNEGGESRRVEGKESNGVLDTSHQPRDKQQSQGADVRRA
jgi:hypothetical protein